MKMTIIRKHFNDSPSCIDGKLYINGELICHTAENMHHCLPEGTYGVSLATCHVAGHQLPVVDMPSALPRNCRMCRAIADSNIKATLATFYDCRHTAKKQPLPVCPRLKMGNSAWRDTDSAVILGQYLMPGVVVRSRPVVLTVIDRLRKHFGRGGTVHLTIINDGEHSGKGSCERAGTVHLDIINDTPVN